jgi:Predicted acyl-CoA transferases/carnitine dehydratase
MTGLHLEGLLVVSLKRAVAAPFATRRLTELVARVIKIERDSGDFARDYDEKVRGMASYFVWSRNLAESRLEGRRARTEPRPEVRRAARPRQKQRPSL